MIVATATSRFILRMPRTSDRFQIRTPHPPVPGARGTTNRCRSKGFTLLEVLIALAVVSIALAALVSAMSSQTRITERLRAKAFAQIVAGNVYNDLRLAERWPALGERDGRLTLAQQRFYWRMEIKTTELPDMRRVEIAVLRDNDNNGNASERDPLLRTSAFVINR